ncbi:MAG: chemotaxis protein CheW [Chitinophagales bacterium]
MELQVVVFRLADEDYGVPIEQVREINRLVPITAVPKAPASVLGVINLREQIIPVVSLRERFGFAREANDDATRIVVSEVGGQTVGFVVDSVNEVLRLGEEAIEPAPPSTAGVDSAFIKGIGRLGDRLIIMLDLERIFDFSTPNA